MKEYIIIIDEDKKDIMGNCPLVQKPQELVRCKDCVYGMMFKNVKDEQRFECVSPTHNGTYVEAHDPDWFCADGERRESDGR